MIDAVEQLMKDKGTKVCDKEHFQEHFREQCQEQRETSIIDVSSERVNLTDHHHQTTKAKRKRRKKRKEVECVRLEVVADGRTDGPSGVGDGGGEGVIISGPRSTLEKELPELTSEWKADKR